MASKYLEEGLPLPDLILPASSVHTPFRSNKDESEVDLARGLSKIFQTPLELRFGMKNFLSNLPYLKFSSIVFSEKRVLLVAIKRDQTLFHAAKIISALYPKSLYGIVLLTP